MTPGQPNIVAVPAPLQWGIGTGAAPDGTKVCVVQLVQANLAITIQLTPHDLKRLAVDLRQAAAQAETALILPPNSVLNGNGHH